MHASQKTTPSRFRDERKFRHEIHGIRGLAIAGVVLFHIFGNGRVSGGIDVFLAITGFLAIPSLVRRAVAGHGIIDLTQRYAGLVRRILLPLIPVLVFIGVGGAIWLPLGAQPDLWSQERASVLFFENIQLINVEQDYNAAGGDVSPLQHLWSIAIQMQFHLVAPFLVMALSIPLMRLDALRWNVPRLLNQAIMLALLIITALSFFHALELQQTSQNTNYFSTWSRIWEITLLGAAALIIPRVRLSSAWRAAFSWSGLLMVISTGFLFNGAQSFPGPLALWPVGGLLLVLVAGQTRSPWGTDRLWQWAPVVFLANISYSLYLWHWPIIIFWFNATGAERLSPAAMVAVLVLSGLCGWLGHVLFERKLANSWFFTRGSAAKWRALLFGVVAVSTAAVAFSHLESRAEEQVSNSLASAAEDLARAEAQNLSGLTANDFVRTSPWSPALDIAWQDLPAIYDDKTQPVPECFQRHSGPVLEPKACSNGVKNPVRTVLLAGGSHVDQWWGAVAELAKQNDIELLLMSRTSCNLWETTESPNSFDDEIAADPESATAKCVEWNRLALPVILEMRPDLVVTLGTRIRYEESIAPHAEAAWQTLTDADIPVLLVRDNPYWSSENDPIECLESAEDPADCFLPRNEVYSHAYDATQFKANLPRDLAEKIHYLDLAPYFCDDFRCPASVANLPLYRDYMHVTQTFSSTFDHVFEEAFHEAGLFDVSGGNSVGRTIPD